MSPNSTVTVSLGYAPVAPLTFTVHNKGSLTGTLSVVLSGPDAGSFDLGASSLASIPVNGNRTFTVAPKPGLVEGFYTTTVTVSGNLLSNVSYVSFTVGPPPYRVVLSVSGTHVFDSVGFLNVFVTNTGTNPTGALSVVLSGTNAGSFTLDESSVPDIAAGGTSRIFTVSPNTGLSSGTYTATVTVSGDNGLSADFTVSFTMVPPLAGKPGSRGLAGPSVGHSGSRKVRGPGYFRGRCARHGHGI